MVEETLMRVWKLEKKEPKYILPILFAIFAILNWLDWIVTDYALSKGATEQNLISKLLIERGIFDETKLGGTMLSVFAVGLFIFLESRYIFVKHKFIYDIFCALIITGIISYIVVLVNNAMRLEQMKTCPTIDALKCVGEDLYQCINYRWELIEKNSLTC
jgi:hypothetical protein